MPAVSAVGTAGRADANLGPNASRLEQRYPQIAQAITLLWGYPEMNDYFGKLWMGEGPEQSIDPEVMADLMLLARVHRELITSRPAPARSIYGSAYGDVRKRDVWGDIPYRR